MAGRDRTAVDAWLAAGLSQRAPFAALGRACLERLKAITGRLGRLLLGRGVSFEELGVRVLGVPFYLSSTRVITTGSFLLNFWSLPQSMVCLSRRGGSTGAFGLSDSIMWTASLSLSLSFSLCL